MEENLIPSLQQCSLLFAASQMAVPQLMGRLCRTTCVFCAAFAQQLAISIPSLSFARPVLCRRPWGGNMGESSWWSTFFSFYLPLGIWPVNGIKICYMFLDYKISTHTARIPYMPYICFEVTIGIFNLIMAPWLIEFLCLARHEVCLYVFSPLCPASLIKYAPTWLSKWEVRH